MEYKKVVKFKVVIEFIFVIVWLMLKLNEFYINYFDIEIDLGIDFELVIWNMCCCDFVILWGDGGWFYYFVELLRFEIYFVVCIFRYLCGCKFVKIMCDVVNFDFIY